MQFTVPQFIEREPKIFGPLTFTQFIYIGSGGVISLMLYFSLAKTKLLLFILIAGVIMLLASVLAFLKVGGRSLPTIMKNFFFFNLAPKMYLWRRKNISPRMMTTVKKIPEPDDGSASPLKVGGGGQLKRLSTQIETKI
jgi:signal transduction histidine kinase